MTACIGCGQDFDQEAWVLRSTQNQRVRILAVTTFLCATCWPSRQGVARLLTTWRVLPPKDPPEDLGMGLICHERRLLSPRHQGK